MMNFIRDNIVKIVVVLVVIIILIVVISACSKMDSTTSNSETGYIEMENKLQNAAIKFVENNKRVLPKTSDKFKRIQTSTLVSNGLLNEMHAIENENVICKGYVDVTKRDTDEDSYRYTPFIKCGKYYQTKTIADYIKENEEIVTSGEGLYQIAVENKEVGTSEVKSTESNNVTPNQENSTNESDEEVDETEEKTDTLYSYYYKGEYPNNYIMLGSRLYRILEITEDNNLKLISTDETEYSYKWDDRFNVQNDEYSGINDFKKSRMKENLDILYTNTNPDEAEVFFSDEEKNMIIWHDFCVGKRSFEDKTINYDSECAEKDNLRVGLISITDYFRTSISEGCTANDKLECNNYNFLFSLNEGYYITLIGNSDTTYEVLALDYGEVSPLKANVKKQLYPVIYIDKNILYKSGSGTQEDPYIVR